MCNGHNIDGELTLANFLKIANPPTVKTLQYFRLYGNQSQQ